jgi:hypothetical protein
VTGLPLHGREAGAEACLDGPSGWASDRRVVRVPAAEAERESRPQGDRPDEPNAASARVQPRSTAAA